MAAALLMAWALAAAAEPRPLVVSSIKPVQLLVAAVAGERVDNRRLLEPTASPHHFQLRPSDARLLRSADAVFWIGPPLERFLTKPLATGSASHALWPGGAGDEHDRGHDHEIDAHIWMSTAQVRRMTQRIVEVLSQRLPAQRAAFEASAETFLRQLAALDRSLAEKLQPVRQRRYLLLHDGYRHFERQYGLQHAAVVTASSEQLPGTRHAAQLRERLLAGEFDCVFLEPQYDPALVASLLRDVRITTIELDPMGVETKVDADGFLTFYRRLGEAFTRCR